MTRGASFSGLRSLLVAAPMLLALGVASPASGDDGKTAFAQAVDEIWRDYTASVSAGDAEAWIKLWDDEGIQLPPGAPANVGKAAILQGITGDFEAFEYRDFVINNEEVEVFGIFGFARGTFSTVLYPTGEGEPIPIDGKYLTIFEQQADGSWKLYRDAFNSNVTPAE